MCDGGGSHRGGDKDEDQEPVHKRAKSHAEDGDSDSDTLVGDSDSDYDDEAESSNDDNYDAYSLPGVGSRTTTTPMQRMDETFEYEEDGDDDSRRNASSAACGAVEGCPHRENLFHTCSEYCKTLAKVDGDFQPNYVLQSTAAASLPVAVFELIAKSPWAAVAFEAAWVAKENYDGVKFWTDVTRDSILKEVLKHEDTKKIAVEKMIDVKTGEALRGHNGATVTTVYPLGGCRSETLTAQVVQQAGTRMWMDLLSLMKFAVDREAWRAPGSTNSCFTFQRWEADLTALLLKLAIHHESPMAVLNTDLLKSFHHANACAKGRKLPHEGAQVELAAKLFSSGFTATNAVVLSKSAGKTAVKKLEYFNEATPEVTSHCAYFTYHLIYVCLSGRNIL